MTLHTFSILAARGPPGSDVALFEAFEAGASALVLLFLLPKTLSAMACCLRRWRAIREEEDVSDYYCTLRSCK